MTSLKKNFSIAKLYSDLEKYNSNLNDYKDSRLKKQTSGTSLHQRPNSSHHKNYESRESLCYPNLTRFQKTKLEVGSRNKNARQTYQKYNYQEKNSFAYDKPDYQGLIKSHNSSVLRQNFRQLDNYRENIRQTYQEKQNRSPKIQFNKTDEMLFLSQCNKLYKLNQKDNSKNLTAEQQADSVKILLNQINKRDKVFETVSKRLGSQNIEQKLVNFFENYDRLKKIVNQFKKMSKLNIEDDQQLYDFLITEDQDKQRQPNQEEEQLTQKKQ